MSSSTPSTQANALIPTVFLIGVTCLLIFFAIPRPYRDPLPVTPTSEPTVVAAVAAQPTPEDHLFLMASGLEEVSASSVQTGSRLFSTTCTACHGSDAHGILGLGKTLVDSGFVDSLNDDELVAFLHVGRQSSDPENTTGVSMPAKGGNPGLTDSDLHAIVDYLRSLNGATVIDDAVGEPTSIPTLKPFEMINVNSINIASPETSSETVSPTDVPQAAPATATPVTVYGYDTQADATQEPTPEPVSMTATPVAVYGYETQGQATSEPTAVMAVEATPTTLYTYQTAPDTTNAPLTYPYESQAPSQP